MTRAVAVILGRLLFVAVCWPLAANAWERYGLLPALATLALCGCVAVTLIHWDD